MNKTNLACLLTITLLAAQPTHLKGGIVSKAVIIVGTVFATSYLWIEFQKENDGNPEAAKDPKKFAQYCYRKGNRAFKDAKHEFDKWISE